MEAPLQAASNFVSSTTYVGGSPDGGKSVAMKMDVWKEKYRLTMSNLMAAAIQNHSPDKVDFDAVDKMVRKILNAQYDGDEAPF